MIITLEDVKREGKGEIISYEGDEALRAVNKYGLALRYVRTQTPEICMAAVKKDGYALQFVHTQTPEICLAAVEQDGYALEHVNVSVFKKEVV